jgi:hypothetical protein
MLDLFLRYSLRIFQFFFENIYIFETENLVFFTKLIRH